MDDDDRLQCYHNTIPDLAYNIPWGSDAEETSTGDFMGIHDYISIHCSNCYTISLGTAHGAIGASITVCAHRRRRDIACIAQQDTALHAELARARGVQRGLAARLLRLVDQPVD